MGNANCKKWCIDDAAFKTLIASPVDSNPESECAICFQVLNADKIPLPCTKRGCASLFHSACIRPWLERNPSCPLCRSDMQQLVRPVTPKQMGTDADILLMAALGRH